MKLKPFSSHTGLVLPLDISNVDTDLIIPKQYLKSIKKTKRQPAVKSSLQQDMDIALNVISHVISVTTVTMIRILQLQFIVIITKMSVVALLPLIAFPLVCS